MIVCAKCGNQAQDDALFCDQCGSRLTPVAEAPPAEAPAAPDSVNCPSCGFSNVPGEMFCENCGARLAAPEPQVASEPAVVEAVPAADVLADVVICPGCGAAASSGDEFCYACGADLGAAAPAEGSAVTVESTEAPVASEDAALAQAPAEAIAAEAAVPGKCPFCGAPVGEGEDFCGYCGAALSDAPAGSKAPAQETAPVTAMPAATPAGGPRLIVVASGVEIPLPAQAEILVGREDPVSGIFPDVDLSPHGGDDGGVSRRHLKITVQGNQYSAEDLGSTNYTLVNKKRLDPGVVQALQDGDEIRAGRIRLVFKQV